MNHLINDMEMNMTKKTNTKQKMNTIANVTLKQIEPLALPEGVKTTSDKIRFFASQGFSKSTIASMLNIRYQHVRNVLITPLKKQS